MLISKGTDYAIRAMLDLARQPAGERVVTEQIAVRQQIPAAFLSKIFASLSQAGLVRAQRGATGGVSLARSAQEISLLDIVLAVQGPLALAECTDPYGRCAFQGRCPAEPVFLRAQVALEQILRETRLGDLAQHKEKALALSVAAG